MNKKRNGESGYSPRFWWGTGGGHGWRGKGIEVLLVEAGSCKQAAARRQGSEPPAIAQLHKPPSFRPIESVGRREAPAPSPGERPCTAIGIGLLE